MVQVVENLEEHFLRAGFSCEKLDVVDDEQVNHLVEMDEVDAVVVFGGCEILIVKLFCLYIQHREVGVEVFGFKADGVAEVGFAQARPAIDQQGIVGGAAWFAGNL